MHSRNDALHPGVEIIELRHTRRRAGTTGLTYGELGLSLFVAAPQGDGPAPARYVFDKIHFEPVRDDLGTLLTSDEFHRHIEYLRAHQKAFSAHRRGEGEAARQGPVLELSLTLPAKRASAIQRLSGIVEVAAVREGTLVIEDVVKAWGNPIDSPLLVDLEVTPIIRQEEDHPIISLRVTGSWDRLYSWHLVKDDENFSYAHEPERLVEGGVELNYRPYFCEKTDADILAGLGIELRVFVPSAVRRCEFDMKNIELP
jgi:hypothetical protein